MSATDTGARSSEEVQLAVDRVPIEGHPGYWRRGRTVCFKYRDRRGRQRWGSARTLTEAKKKRAAVETDVARGEFRERSRARFDTYARGWLDTFQGRTSKPITAASRARYRRAMLGDAIPYFGSMLLAEIEPQDVKSYTAHVARRRRRGKRYEKSEETVSADTVRLALAPVKAMLATALEEGLLRTNPAAGVRVAVPRHVDVDDDEGEVKAMTLEQASAVLDAIAADELEKGWADWHLFFRVLLALGLRFGEIVELRWRDVDLGARTVRIRRSFSTDSGEVGPPKTRYGRRTVKLTRELATALWQLRKDTRAVDRDLVFTAARGGRVSASNLMSRVLKPAARRAGVGDWVGFHTFRHTCATLLFTRADPPWNAKQVQLWLGHHSPSFTLERYVHLLPDDLPEPPDLTGGTSPGTRTGTQSTRSDPNAEAAAAAESGG